jgi:hypothetical protein
MMEMTAAMVEGVEAVWAGACDAGDAAVDGKRYFEGAGGRLGTRAKGSSPTGRLLATSARR